MLRLSWADAECLFWSLMSKSVIIGLLPSCNWLKSRIFVHLFEFYSRFNIWCTWIGSEYFKSLSIIDFFIFKICMPLIFILKNRHILKLNLELLALNIILFFLKVYCWNVGIWKTSWNPSASWKESLLSILWKICILNGDQFQKSEK